MVLYFEDFQKLFGKDFQKIVVATIFRMIYAETEALNLHSHSSDKHRANFCSLMLQPPISKRQYWQSLRFV
ncbi:hypothetical protein GGU45_004125 [Niabella hirudinis]